MFVGAVAGAAVEEVNISTYIQSVQSGTISINGTAGGTSNTAAISSVNVNNTVLFWGGHTTNAGGGDTGMIYGTLTDGTTVTANRKVNGTAVPAYRYNAVEFIAGTMKTPVQYGSITIDTATTTGTATISAVSSTACLILLGHGSGISTSWNDAICTIDLTNGTTVTATTASTQSSTGGGLTVNFCVVDFVDSIVKSCQKVSLTTTVNTSSYTTSLSPSVNTNNTILIWNGQISTAALISSAHNMTLTNGSTVTFLRNSTGTTSRTIKAMALELRDGVLNSVARQGGPGLNGTTSNTEAVSPAVTTSKCAVSFGGFRSNSSTTAQALSRIALTDGSTITATKQVSTGTTVVSWELFEFK